MWVRMCVLLFELNICVTFLDVITLDVNTGGGAFLYPICGKMGTDGVPLQILGAYYWMLILFQDQEVSEEIEEEKTPTKQDISEEIPSESVSVDTTCPVSYKFVYNLYFL